MNESTAGNDPSAEQPQHANNDDAAAAGAESHEEGAAAMADAEDAVADDADADKD